MSKRTIDIPTIDKWTALTGVAKEHGLALTVDYLGPMDLWVVQLFDMQEKLIVSGNGECMRDAVGKVYQGWLQKTGPKL